MAREAGFLALDEKAEGRKTVILFPDTSWGAVMFDMGAWPEGIYPGTTDKPFDKEVDTVITVVDEKCNQGMVNLIPCTKRIRIRRGAENIVENR